MAIFGRRRSVAQQYTGQNVSVMLPRYTTPPEHNTREWFDMFGKNPRLAVVDRIASDLSTCTGKLFRVNPETGEETEIESHPFLDFMAKPNPLYEMSAAACWRLLQIYLELKGEGYFVYEFDAAGRPAEIWPLPTSWVQETPYIGHPYYEVKTTSGNILQVPVDDVFYMKELNPLDPYKRGLGSAEALADEIETDEYAAKFQKKFFYNDATPSTLIAMPGSSKDQRARFREEWNEKFRGPFNSHGIATIDGEVTVTKLAENMKDKYGDESMSREFKALNATSPSAGGFLIPEVYLDDVIELLYSKTIIKELGARTIPMETGNINIPRMTSGTRASWGGEARKIKATQPSFGNLRLSAKRLEAIVPQTRELIMSTKYSADEMFAADLSRRMQLGLDWGGLYGKGGEFQPTGIANTAGIEIIDAKNLNNTSLADASGRITADFPVYVKSLLMSKNVDDVALGWGFNSFMEGYLMNLKTATGDYLYRDEMNQGKFLGMNYAVTNQIPTSKDGLTDIFFGNWADLMIGDQMGLETYTTLDGSWTDEDGIQHNAFEENLTGTRALMYDDIGVRHVESFAYVKNVKVF